MEEKAISKTGKGTSTVITVLESHYECSYLANSHSSLNEYSVIPAIKSSNSSWLGNLGLQGTREKIKQKQNKNKTKQCQYKGIQLAVGYKLP